MTPQPHDIDRTLPLRNQLIEAMAKAANDEGWTCEAHEPDPFGECSQCLPGQTRLAQVTLDAALDVLEANPPMARLLRFGDDWGWAVDGLLLTGPDIRAFTKALIAVLRSGLDKETSSGPNTIPVHPPNQTTNNQSGLDDKETP